MIFLYSYCYLLTAFCNWLPKDRFSFFCIFLCSENNTTYAFQMPILCNPSALLFEKSICYLPKYISRQNEREGTQLLYFLHFTICECIGRAFPSNVRPSQKICYSSESSKKATIFGTNNLPNIHSFNSRKMTIFNSKTTIFNNI